MFKTICVDHVGIACKDLDLSKKFYTEVLGLSCTGEEAVPEQGVHAPVHRRREPAKAGRGVPVHRHGVLPGAFHVGGV